MSKAGDLYGQSLYDLAAEENLTEKILGEMETVRGILRENPDYITLLSEPSVPKNERLTLVDQAFDGSLEAYHLNFIKILIEKGLLREYSACYKRFRKSYNEAHGIAEALVTSAVSLSDAQLSQLKEKLEELTGDVTDINIDMSDLAYTSSAGLRLFLQYHNLLLKAGGKLTLMYPNDMIMEIFEDTGMADSLNIVR